MPIAPKAKHITIQVIIVCLLNFLMGIKYTIANNMAELCTVNANNVREKNLNGFLFIAYCIEHHAMLAAIT